MSTLDIKVLGPGCKNCVMLDKITKDAVAELGLDATIEKVEDYAEIAAYNIMSTPGLVINGEVVVSGRVPTPRHVKELLQAASE